MIKIKDVQDLKSRVTALMIKCDSADYDECDLHEVAFRFIADLDHAIVKLSQRKAKEAK